MGGYNFQMDQTWNYILLADILKHTSINHLEFLAGLIKLLLAESYCRPADHILLWIDNSTAIS